MRRSTAWVRVEGQLEFILKSNSLTAGGASERTGSSKRMQVVVTYTMDRYAHPPQR